MACGRGKPQLNSKGPKTIASVLHCKLLDSIKQTRFYTNYFV